MIIKHNLLAMSASRFFGNTTALQKKTTEKLSSGYRINRAADDAAGLSISEKMRKQIRGLTRGVQNAEEGISLCQVADGALEEVHDMLQRINELAVHSANGTLTASDRDDVDAEVQSLKKEIKRVADSTKFNEIPIFHLDSSSSITPGTGAGVTAVSKIFQLLAGHISGNGYMDESLQLNSFPDSQATFDWNYYAGFSTNPNNPYVTAHMDLGVLGTNLKDLIGCQFYVNCCTDDCPKVVNFVDTVGISYDTEEHVYDSYKYLSGINIGLKKSDGSYYTDATEFNKYIVDTLRPVIDPYLTGSDFFEHVQFGYNGSTLYVFDVDNNNWSPANMQAAYFCDAPNSTANNPNAIEKRSPIWIQSGAEKGDGMFLSIDGFSLESLGITNLSTKTQNKSLVAIDSVEDAIADISAQRSKIGAYQNRLEHTIRNENNIIENTTYAESRIRDTDMALHMVAFSNQQILLQAGQSMLAQANQSGQGVLNLLN